jgi:hypothetical protein
VLSSAAAADQEWYNHYHCVRVVSILSQLSLLLLLLLLHVIAWLLMPVACTELLQRQHQLQCCLTSFATVLLQLHSKCSMLLIAAHAVRRALLLLLYKCFTITAATTALTAVLITLQTCNTDTCTYMCVYHTLLHCAVDWYKNNCIYCRIHSMAQLVVVALVVTIDEAHLMLTGHLHAAILR